MAPPPMFNEWFFYLDFGFTLLMIIFSFLIYFKTRESYQLTKHQGIKYFRGAFLFFGLSYMLRFILGLMMLSGRMFDWFMPHELFPLQMVLLSYFSTMGILYILFISIWKKFEKVKLWFIAHTIAVVLSVIAFITRSPMILSLLQLIILIVAVILILLMKSDSKKKLSSAKGLYLMVAFLWLLNLFGAGERRPFLFEINIILQVISVLIFVFVYYKISKWLK